MEDCRRFRQNPAHAYRHIVVIDIAEYREPLTDTRLRHLESLWFNPSQPDG